MLSVIKKCCEILKKLFQCILNVVAVPMKTIWLNYNVVIVKKEFPRATLHFQICKLYS